MGGSRSGGAPGRTLGAEDVDGDARTVAAACGRGVDGTGYACG